MADRKRHSKLSKDSKEFDRKSEQDCNCKKDEGAKTPPLPPYMRPAKRLKKNKDTKDITNRHFGDLKSIDEKIPNRTTNNNNLNNNLSKKIIHNDIMSDPTDSEDEESIIEQRRKQRKQLIEKLCTTVNENSHVSSEKHEVNELNATNTKASNESNRSIENTTKKSADMFAEKDEFDMQSSITNQAALEKDSDNLHLKDNWDDTEGYYIIKYGDLLNNNRYVIKNIMGQGMFATVVKAIDKSTGNRDVAIKIARNNDLIYNTALKEIATLKTIDNSDLQDKNHCVKLIRYFTHRGHMCLVLESFGTDLRSILKKLNKKQGLNIKTTACYSQQILLALKHLYKCRIIHADLKPDNILINEKKNFLKLCDFGSAENGTDNVEVKPYLVSRFYRAPEIILGLGHSYGIDLWSAACTMYEMATGRILFTGGSNNKMIKCFIDVKGKIPNKLINIGKFKNEHFNYNNNFLLHKKDEMTGRDKVVEIIQTTSTRNLMNELKQYGTTTNPKEEKMICQLKDVLDKTLTIDPNHRPTIDACLNHPFLQDANIRF